MNTLAKKFYESGQTELQKGELYNAIYNEIEANNFADTEIQEQNLTVEYESGDLKMYVHNDEGFDTRVVNVMRLENHLLDGYFRVNRDLRTDAMDLAKYE